MAEVVAAADTTLTPASQLCVAAVLGRDGTGLGHIVELMIEADTGRIGYAALAIGGVMGVGETLHAVPWGCFRIDPLSQILQLPLVADELRALGGFDKDSWPACGDGRIARLPGFARNPAAGSAVSPA
jgi:hypothetical protein